MLSQALLSPCDKRGQRHEFCSSGDRRTSKCTQAARVQAWRTKSYRTDEMYTGAGIKIDSETHA